MRNQFDLKALGAAIRCARESRKWTRPEFAEMLGICDKHLANIEDRGANPSVQLLFKIVNTFHISLDQFFSPDKLPHSLKRQQINTLLNHFTEADLTMAEAILTAIYDNKNQKHEV